MPTRINVAVPDRASLALANLIRGDGTAAVRSMLAPDTLSPREHADLVDQWFGEGESFQKSVARFLTNPITIIGAALAYRWPAPALAMLEPTVAAIKQYDKYIPSVLRKLSGLNEIFAGTGVDDAFAYVTRVGTKYWNDYAAPGLGKGLDEYVSSTKKLPAIPDQIAAFYDWDILGPSGEATRDAINSRIRDAIKNVKSGNWVNPGGRPALNLLRELNDADFALQRPLDGNIAAYRNAIRDQTVAPQYAVIQQAADNGALKDVFRTLQRQGVAVSEGAPEQIAGYAPHLPMRTQDELKAAFDQVAAEQLDQRLAEKIQAASVANQVTSRFGERYNAMVPALRHLDVLKSEGYIGDALPDAMGALEDLYKANGQSLRQYDMRMVEVARQYTRAMERTYVFNVARDTYDQGVGTWLRDQTQAMARSGGQGVRHASLLANTYIPAALGRMPMEQYLRSLEWGSLREFSSRVVDSEFAGATLGPRLQKRLSDMINFGPELGTWHGAGGKLAGYFYLTTLGLNPASAAQNLLQTILTTGTMVKPQFIMQGMDAAWRGMSKVTQLVKAGASESEAMAQIFPDFAEQGLGHSRNFADSIRDAASELGADKRLAGATSLYEKVSDTAMTLFGTAERFNHLSTFEAARAQSLAEGVIPDSAAQIAAKVTRLTQDYSGPYAVPSGLVNTHPLYRQFLSFPAKLAAFYGNAALSTGGAFNPGMIGRAALGSMAAYELARGTTGADISRGLMFGAVPGPQENGPFAPLPVMPPVFEIAGSMGLDLAKGKLENTPKILPLLVPGGVALSRALPLLAGEVESGAGEAVGEVVNRAYADYDNPDPTGNIAVYRPDGSLQGKFSPLSIIMRAVGGQMSPDMSGNEAAAARYLVRQRDQIRDYRTRYVSALMTNEVTDAEGIDQEYQQRFNIGPITVKKTDVRAWWLRRDIARLERLMEQLPQDARPLYSTVIGTAFANGGEGLIGVDPAMLATGTVRSRRMQPPTGFNQEQPQPSGFASGAFPAMAAP